MTVRLESEIRRNGSYYNGSSLGYGGPGYGRSESYAPQGQRSEPYGQGPPPRAYAKAGGWEAGSSATLGPLGAPPAFVSPSGLSPETSQAQAQTLRLRRSQGRGQPQGPPHRSSLHSSSYRTYAAPQHAYQVQPNYSAPQLVPPASAAAPLPGLPRFHSQPHNGRFSGAQPQPPPSRLQGPPQAPAQPNGHSNGQANGQRPSRRSSHLHQPLHPSASPHSLIWSASPHNNGAEGSSGGEGKAEGGGRTATRPTVVLRKPRSRRLLRSLLCCFGVKPHGTSAPTAGAKAEGQLKGLGPAQPSPAQPYLPKASEKLLLPPLQPPDLHKKCLIIDLDETLVHSSFKPVKNADFVIPVEIDGVIHQVYVLKRPHVDEFLERIGGLFECVLFTASLAKYADPVADLLDRGGVFRSRLFREACVFHKGNYVKDLARLGRDLKRVLIVDNSPASYAFHPDNAIPVQSWFDDPSDTELLDLLPILQRMVHVDNVYSVLRNANDPLHA